MKDSSGVVVLFCFSLKIILWEYVGEFHPLRWIFLLCPTYAPKHAAVKDEKKKCCHGSWNVSFLSGDC